MLQKKVCMVGAFATGKTSLVARFVKGIYSDKYQTTIGVKIDKKQVTVKEQRVNQEKTLDQEQTINMVLWDIYGEDEFQNIKLSYLRGSAGYLLVVDGTRRETLEIAIQLQAKVEQHIGCIPFVMLINKFDIQPEWEVTEADIEEMRGKGWAVCLSSAKTNLGVEDGFAVLAQQMLGLGESRTWPPLSSPPTSQPYPVGA